MNDQFQQSPSSQSSSTGIHAYDYSHHRNSSGEELEHLRSQLSKTKKQLRDQELRTQEAKRELLGITTLLKDVNDKRLAAVQDAQRANEELKLYKIQLQRAQQVIFDAQGLLDSVDRQRHRAEQDAAKARTALRRLNREVMLRQAMEEGRRIGLREGFERGQELEFDDYDSVDEEVRDKSDRNNMQYRPRSLFITSAEDIRRPRSPIRQDPVLPSDPSSAPRPEVQKVPNHRPRRFRSPSPSAYRENVSIPPEGYIPALDDDHIIRIPPPHELSRPPPTPERAASPPLPPVAERGEPMFPTRPRSDRSVRSGHQRNVSLGSVSTSLSQLELVNGPGLGNPSGRRSPLSVIPEVRSIHSGSPNPPVSNPGLNHQPSWASSHQSNGVQPGESSRSRAGSVKSFNPTEIQWRSGLPMTQEYTASASPKPLSVLLQSHTNANSVNIPSEHASTWGASPANSQVPLPVPPPIPGSYGPTYEASPSFTSAVQYPDEQGDNKSVSSGMSKETLTTPVLGRRHR